MEGFAGQRRKAACGLRSAGWGNFDVNKVAGGSDCEVDKRLLELRSGGGCSNFFIFCWLLPPCIRRWLGKEAPEILVKRLLLPPGLLRLEFISWCDWAEIGGFLVASGVRV